MAYRTFVGHTYIASIVGGVFTHGLGATPDEYGWFTIGTTAVSGIAASAADSVAIYLTGTAGCRLNVFAAVNHSIIK
jgi:hypothetical protein